MVGRDHSGYSGEDGKKAGVLMRSECMAGSQRNHALVDDCSG